MTNEQYLAGAILLDEKAADRIRGIVSPSDFTDAMCRAVFEAAQVIADRKGVIDPITIMEQCGRQGIDLPADYLMQLMEITPSATHCTEYASRVREESRTRSVKALAQRIIEDDSSADELLSALRSGAEGIGAGHGSGLLNASDLLLTFYDGLQASRVSFVPSGFRQLDEVLGGGFIRSGLYILAARPGVGKTSFALNLFEQMRGSRLFITLEMSPEQLITKVVSRMARIPGGKLREKCLSDRDWETVGTATTAISMQDIRINSAPALSVPQIHALAKTIPGLTVIFVDYLQLAQPSEAGKSRYEEVTKISMGLKAMARDLDVPVVCLCQLSRDAAKRQDKRPQLSDLRDSGQIEQDADSVLFLFREDYETEVQADPSRVQLIVAKNRHAGTGSVEFEFWKSVNDFREVSSR